MRTGRRELKRRARLAMRGNYSAAVGAQIMILVFAGLNMLLMTMCRLLYLTWALLLEQTISNRVMEGLKVAGILIFLVFYSILIPGFKNMYFNICLRGKGKMSQVFWGFGPQLGKYLGLGLLLALAVAVAQTPVIVLTAAMSATGERVFPEFFLKSYIPLLILICFWLWLNYGLFYLVWADHPKESLVWAIRRSRELIRGKRMKFFLLNLSFAGWYVLALLSCGIGFFWLRPYRECANLFFYLDLKESQKQE